MAGTKIERTTHQGIYERIRDDITFGHLLPGERLTEIKLSGMYQVSRSPIREALRQLQSDGLIRFERNKGMEVTKLSIEKVAEIYDVRALQEGFAVRIGIDRLDSEDIDNLTALHNSLILAARNRDMREWIDKNSTFHAYFRDKAGNETLNQLIMMLKRRTFLYQRMSLSFDRYYDVYVDHHADILDACRKRDLDRAEFAMRTHVMATKQAVVENLLMTLDTRV
jgi:DNA-binding GntR family transcriptional regulator